MFEAYFRSLCLKSADLARFAFAAMTVRILENYTAKYRSQNRILEDAICSLFGHLKGGVHDPLPVGPIYIEELQHGGDNT